MTFFKSSGDAKKHLRLPELVQYEEVAAWRLLQPEIEKACWTNAGPDAFLVKNFLVIPARSATGQILVAGKNYGDVAFDGAGRASLFDGVLLILPQETLTLEISPPCSSGMNVLAVGTTIRRIK